MHLNNTNLLCEIIISKHQGRLTKNAENYIILIAKEAIKVRPYKSAEDKADCLQSGLLDMFKNWYKFDEERYTNAFAYFTEVFKRGRAKGFNEIYRKKGDNDNNIKLISIEGSNDGQGLHSI